MRNTHLKQIGLIILLACLTVSLINFVNINREQPIAEWDVAKFREQKVAINLGNMKDDLVKYRQLQHQRLVSIPVNFRPDFDVMRRGPFEDVFKKYDVNIKKSRFLVPSFNNETIKFATQKPQKKAFPAPEAGRIHSFSGRMERRPRRKNSPRKKRVRSKPRYLINYSNFSNNEQLREKVLFVHRNSSQSTDSVWFHRSRNSNGKTTYNDGILEQLNFVPQSYINKLKKLNLFKVSKHPLVVENRAKLHRYLSQEFDEFYQDFYSFKKEYVIIKHNASEILRNELRPVPEIDYDSATPNWSSLERIIYLPDGLPSIDIQGREKLLQDDCPISACFFTDNKYFEKRAHLRLFQSIPQEEYEKPQSQIWALFLLESPMNTFITVDLKDSINWTATFRWDSTIVTPYAKFVPSHTDEKNSSQHHNHLPKSTLTKNYAKGKTRLVAWFVSNCFTSNKRTEITNELRKYIQVDSYGECGSLKCDKRKTEECFSMLSSDYKFYLSFENSNCDSYITEKFFENALGNDIVPVVLGARKEDYLRSAPPHSFIHVEDFETIKDLADYLLLLDKNETLYNSYLAWKGHGNFINTKFWCRLCTMLQDDDMPVMWYRDFLPWWKHTGACRVERWRGTWKNVV